MVSILVFVAIVLALLLMTFNYFKLKKFSEGTYDMADIASIIRNGAKTFMVAEYKTIVIVVMIVAILLSLFIEKFAGPTFILGASMSSATCIIGMRSATYANVRTANKARESLSIGETVKVALTGGIFLQKQVYLRRAIGLNGQYRNHYLRNYFYYKYYPDAP